MVLYFRLCLFFTYDEECFFRAIMKTGLDPYFKVQGLEHGLGLLTSYFVLA
jgi:hypothetical protein